MASGVGVWEAPGSRSGALPDAALLERFSALGAGDLSVALGAELSAAEQRQHAGLMKLSEQQWQQAAALCSDEQLLGLVRFFTVAEEQLPGWEAGDRSPVIWLCRMLKGRGRALDQELLRWIRSRSSNRFLPYGGLS